MISLCVISGNCQNHVIRFLDSFKDVFDELCMVRAIGYQELDRTIDLTSAWCEKNKKVFQFREYKNSLGHWDWPHIDNFGAARRMSFELATNDF